MRQHHVASDCAIGQTARESEARRCSCDRFKTKMLEIACRADVPRIRNREAAALMKRAKSFSSLGYARHCPSINSQHSTINCPHVARMRNGAAHVQKFCPGDPSSQHLTFVSHIENDAEARFAAHHAIVSLSHFLQRINFIHRLHTGRHTELERVL